MDILKDVKVQLVPSVKTGYLGHNTGATELAPYMLWKLSHSSTSDREQNLSKIQEIFFKKGGVSM